MRRGGSGAARLLLLLAAACGEGGGSQETPDAGPPPAPELGTGDHTPASVVFTAIATAGDALSNPRDLAFNPRIPTDLWIVNRDDDSVTIVHDAPSETRAPEHRMDPYAFHFMDAPVGISFGADETTFGVPGTFATCGESRNDYNGTTDPNDFMGPTLWSSDLSIFGVQDPDGLGSHIDMLHCTPLCMGIEHQEANIYWTFGGQTQALFKYDFALDHGVGQDDHSDGSAYRYVTGQVGYVPGVPGHLAYDAATRMLYVADPGNARVARLDTTKGTKGEPLVPLDPMDEYYEMDGTSLVDVVAQGLERPSGIELWNGYLYVSDWETSVIYAFTLDGEKVNWLDTGLPRGALSGMAFGPDGKVYFTDGVGNQVLRVDPL